MDYSKIKAVEPPKHLQLGAEMPMSDIDFTRLMVTHTRGWFMPASADTFCKFYPELASHVDRFKDYHRG